MLSFPPSLCLPVSVLMTATLHRARGSDGGEAPLSLYLDLIKDRNNLSARRGPQCDRVAGEEDGRKVGWRTRLMSNVTSVLFGSLEIPITEWWMQHMVNILVLLKTQEQEGNGGWCAGYCELCKAWSSASCTPETLCGVLTPNTVRHQAHVGRSNFGVHRIKELEKKSLMSNTEYYTTDC